MKCSKCGIDKEEIKIVLEQLLMLSQRRTDELERLLKEKIDILVNIE